MQLVRMGGQRADGDEDGCGEPERWVGCHWITSMDELEVSYITTELYAIKLTCRRGEWRVPGAGKHGQPGILRKARISGGKLAEDEDRSPCGCNSTGVEAIRAQS